MITREGIKEDLRKFISIENDILAYMEVCEEHDLPKEFSSYVYYNLGRIKALKDKLGQIDFSNDFRNAIEKSFINTD